MLQYVLRSLLQPDNDMLQYENNMRVNLFDENFMEMPGVCCRDGK
jgi:hypothetical protein